MAQDEAVRLALPSARGWIAVLGIGVASACTGGDGWRTTASASIARGQHVTSVLSSGEVLVVGGHYNPDPVTRTELFDPEAETWRTTDSIDVARYGGWGIGVRLEDGDILLGGQGGNPSERFSTEDEQWSPDAAFADDRDTYRLTVLDDGRVLVAGGMNWTLEEVTTATEVYDPTTRRWTEAGAMNHPRYGHAQHLLADGRVLVAGGSTTADFDKTDTAEVYDPGTDTWSVVGSLAMPKTGLLVTLPTGEALLVGGRGTDALLQDTEIFDPTTGVWRPGPTLLEPRNQHTTTVLADGRVVVIGGRQSFNDGDGRRSVEILDPEAMVWEQAGDMARGRSEHGATLLPSGEILVTGGATRYGWLDSAEIFTPE